MSRICLHCINQIPKREGDLVNYCEKCAKQELRGECNCTEHYFREPPTLKFEKHDKFFVFDEEPIQLTFSTKEVNGNE